MNEPFDDANMKPKLLKKCGHYYKGLVDSDILKSILEAHRRRHVYLVTQNLWIQDQ